MVVKKGNGRGKGDSNIILIITSASIVLFNAFNGIYQTILISFLSA